MAQAVFPVAVSSSSSPSTIAQTFTATSANVMYNGTNAFSAGTYTITCAASSIAVVDFWNGTTYIGSATTASGTVTFNLATAATRIAYYVNTGSSIVISATLTGNPVSSVTGTLDTITTSGLYTATGIGYVVAVGGGGGGGGGGWNNTAAASGGTGVTSGYGARGRGGQGANASQTEGNAGASGTAGIVYVLRF